MHYINIIGEIGTDYTVTDAVADLTAAKDSQEITLLIDSVGGYVDAGLQIYEIFKNSGKVIHSKGVGNVCSIATLFWILAEKQNRTFDFSKGIFLIHNPWVANISGDAERLKLASEEMASLELILEKIYEKHLGIDKGLVSELMKLDKPMTEAEFLKLNLGNVENIDNKPIAKLNTDNMGFLTNLAKLIGGENAKAILLQDAAGTELEFPELTEGDTPKVGDAVNVGGAPANGEYTMPDGTVYKCEGGKLVEIMAPEAKTNDEVDALKAEIEALKSANAAKDSLLLEAKNEIRDLRSKFPTVKKEVNTPNPTEPTNPNTEKKVINKKSIQL
jgi:ATP-dependent Clp protease, protease subunit